MKMSQVNRGIVLMGVKIKMIPLYFQIFTPTDPHLTWALAKMWYNNSDAGYHQAITHLGMLLLLCCCCCCRLNVVVLLLLLLWLNVFVVVIVITVAKMLPRCGTTTKTLATTRPSLILVMFVVFV